jgi:pimeloyl-ACP methyl ester carboxylesterase
MAIFRRNGIAFSYLDGGEGSPLVLQHGLGGDQSQPAGLHGSAGRLICLECRGHGETAPLGPVEDLGFQTFADDLLALVDQLGLSSFVLGGVSMGAGVALRFAADHPERVRGLVLIRPAWLDQPSPANLRPLTRIGELLLEHGPREGRELFLTDAEYVAALRESPATAESMLGQFDRPYAQEHAEVLRRMPADCPLGTAPDWARLDMPAVVMGTAQDPMHPLELATALAGALPNAEGREVTSKTVDDAAHRRDVSAAIDDFLAGLDAPRGSGPRTTGAPGGGGGHHGD